MDYLTKWPEVFTAPDQKASTIARIFVEHMVTRHGVPEQLLSDRGANFLSSIVQEVCALLGVMKINTSGYHPQTDGLVERFNRALITMLSKSVERHDRDWDMHLPYLLFAYCVSVQASTKETPFFLLYGRDPRTPTATALSQPTSPYQVDVEDYRTELVSQLSDAWELAHKNIKIAQSKQKLQHDKRSREVNIQKGDRVMVRMPGTVKGKAWKLKRPYHGPYRVLTMTATNVEVVLVDEPTAEPIFVALDRVKPCFPELADVPWTGERCLRRSRKSKDMSRSDSVPYSGPITRSRSKCS